MNSRPTYRVATAGLDQRDVRLIDIVFKHSRHNRVAYKLVPVVDDTLIDILIVNPFEPDGLRTLSRIRARGSRTPLVTAVPPGMQSGARHAIHIERLTLQVLPILNSLVDQEFGRADDAPAVFQQKAPVVQSPAAARSGQGSDPSTIISSTFVDSVFASTLADAHASRLRAAGPPPSDPTEFGPSVRAVPVPPVSILAQELVAEDRESKPGNLVPFPNNDESAAKPITVLVVDDSPTVRRQMSLALNRMGLHCVAVSSAASALAKMRDTHFELAMVDVVLGDMDGYRLTREIRRMYRSTPVIILTSKSSPIDLARGALAGCSSYLVKPVPLKKIESAVMRQLRKTLAIDDLEGLIRLTAPARRKPAKAKRARRSRPETSRLTQQR